MRFASENARYQADGRTVSTEDDRAYLTSSPPRYKRRHGTVLLAVVVALLVGGMMYVYANGSDSSSILYDYEMDGIQNDGSTCLVQFTVKLVNNTDESIDAHNIVLMLKVGSHKYPPRVSLYGTLDANHWGERAMVYSIDPKYADSEMVIEPVSDYNLKRDDSLL